MWCDWIGRRLKENFWGGLVALAIVLLWWGVGRLLSWLFW